MTSDSGSAGPARHGAEGKAVSSLYNENDGYPAAWLRNLIDAGHIAPGTADERSVADLGPKDLDGITQAHFFAGIGVWSYALRLAGWADDAPAWTGSCPCQPFSAAGRGRGHADERHLWPAWFRLIRECRPPVVFGEQVASPAGLAWLDAVRADLEGEGYAFGAADLCAAGVGAPHIRQRLFFVADAQGEHGDLPVRRREPLKAGAESGGCGAAGTVAHAERDTGVPWRAPVEPREGDGAPSAWPHAEPRRCGLPSRLGDAQGDRRGRGPDNGDEGRRQRPSATAGFWRDAEWIACRDGRARPVKPGTFPLVDGTPARVGRLRAYGNAIVPQVAAAFVRAFMDALPEEARP